ncbi:MAG: glycoside hydrolase family 57 protein [Ferruginibacter sp.]
MPSVTLYFKVHQPYRLHHYELKDVNVIHSYIDTEATKKAINVIADECYLPANEIIYALLKQYAGKFKIAFSISGVTLEILDRYRPDVLHSFRKIVKTGNAEILAETYYNSLSWLHSKPEFERQVKKHDAIVKRLLGTEPSVFRNTELIYNNELAVFIAKLGYKGLLCEGSQRILDGRTPNQVYAAPGNGDFGLLLRNVNMSDDIAFRFDDTNWNEYPLTAEKFAAWIHGHADGNLNLFLDYETFGIHKKASTGIFDFLKALPEHILMDENYSFSTPSAVLADHYPVGVYDVPQTISWEDRSADNCVWCETMEQHNTLRKIYSLCNSVYSGDNESMTETWGKLQSADYFYYMGKEDTLTKKAKAAGNPYPCNESAYHNYLNILTDLELSLIRFNLEKYKTGSTYINNLY